MPGQHGPAASGNGAASGQLVLLENYFLGYLPSPVHLTASKKLPRI
jgi:hypothetical protein